LVTKRWGGIFSYIQYLIDSHIRNFLNGKSSVARGGHINEAHDRLYL
jgi:hypothetical protein